MDHWASHITSLSLLCSYLEIGGRPQDGSEAKIGCSVWKHPGALNTGMEFSNFSALLPSFSGVSFSTLFQDMPSCLASRVRREQLFIWKGKGREVSALAGGYRRGRNDDWERCSESLRKGKASLPVRQRVEGAQQRRQECRGHWKCLDLQPRGTGRPLNAEAWYD